MGITDQTNKFLGIISTGISIDRLYSKANQARFSLNSSFVLLSEDLQLISARQEDQDFFQDKITSAITKDQAGLLPKPREYKGSKYYCYRKLKNWPFLILVGENSISLQNEFNNKVIPHVIQITIIAFLMLLFFYLVRRQIISPIVDLAKITKAISLGADNVAIPMYNSNEMNLLAEELIKLQNYTSELRVTKEKLESAQETLASSNQILERNVIERTASLEQDLAAKTQFLNNISHEVRTPIQGITAISEGLVENWYSFDEEKKYYYVQQVAINAQRLFGLAANLLDMSKLSANKMILNFQKIDFCFLVEDMLKEAMSLYVLDKNIQLSFNAVGPLYIVADQEKMIQVLRNLFANAIKFSPDNTKIIANASLTTMSFDSDNNERKYQVEAIHFTLADQGIGIPQEELQEIFEPFTQSSLTRTRSGGTGLGLAIVKEIILAHYGKIWAESDEHGSKFHFIIPILQYTP